jgi:hypothetical protein
MLPKAMTDLTDDALGDEHEAREKLIDAEVEAQETLDEAERLQEDDAQGERRNDSDAK